MAKPKKNIKQEQMQEQKEKIPAKKKPFIKGKNPKGSKGC